jgi:predicted phage terminase large subunit-like protein
LIQQIKIEEEIKRRICVGSFKAFVVEMWSTVEPSTPFVDGWHIDVLCQHLEAVAEFDIKKLVINMPPRHMKSILCAVMFPAWVWLRYPERKFIYASYAEAIAIRDSIKTRNLLSSDKYRSLFKIKWNLAEDQNQKKVFQNTLGGERVAVGVGSGLTGQGGDYCFVAGTKVMTRLGETSIENIKIGDEVLSYDVKSGTLRYNSVKKLSRRHVTELLKAEFSNGRKVISTPEHLFFSPRQGYRPIQGFKVNDEIIEVRNRTGEGVSYRNEVSVLRRFISSEVVRLSKGIEKIKRFLLFESMFEIASQYKESKTMRDMRRKDRKQNAEVLQKLQGACNRRPTVGIRRKIQGDSAAYIIARRFSVFRMRRRPKVDSTPHRRSQVEQRTDEFNNTMSAVPHYASLGSVRSIERIQVDSGSPVAVYDIEVGRDNNFIAEGVVVHNCIIDDALNALDAFSESMRDSANMWHDMTFSTRYNNAERHAKVIIMQRLHEDDLTGHVLKTGAYEHLILPARYEPDSDLKSKTSLDFRDPRKIKGQLLWPERFNELAIKDLERDLREHSEAQLQQDPKPPRGGLFPRDNWQFFDKSPSPILDLVQFWDCAEKPGITNDYSVCATWAKTENGFYLLDLWRDKVDAPTLEELAKTFFSKWRPTTIVIEDKSHGSALIQYLLRFTTLPVVGMIPTKSKELRAISASSTVKAKKCFLPSGVEFVKDFIKEHEKFPRSKHDDQVDTTSMAVIYFNENDGSGPNIRSV